MFKTSKFSVIHPFFLILYLNRIIININNFNSSPKYYYYWWPIGKPLDTHWRPIGDWHAWSETHRGPQHASQETDMPHLRPTCLIGEPSETDKPHRRPKCLRSLIRISTRLSILIFIRLLRIYIYWNNILGHVGFRWVYNEACRGLRWSISRSLMKYVKVFDQACQSPMGLR